MVFYPIKYRIMKYLLNIIMGLISISGCAQNNDQKKQSDKNIHIGGRCEGCEAIYESPVPFEKLNSVDTLPDFNEPGPKIEISGIVYQQDGKTPAKDVVIYIYHTDQKGIYAKKGNDPDNPVSYRDRDGWGKRHGYIRGWVKTDKNGFYQFFTLRPGSYPGLTDPAHIHVTVKETDKNEYWIDEYLFTDDPLFTVDQRKKAANRGGNGIIELVPQKNGISHCTRHIILGMNIPDYPF